MHICISIARAQKILVFMSQTGECQQQKHTQHAPSMKTECDYLSGWIKTVTFAKISPKIVNPRNIDGERRRRRRTIMSKYMMLQYHRPINPYSAVDPGSHSEGSRRGRRTAEGVGRGGKEEEAGGGKTGGTKTAKRGARTG